MKRRKPKEIELNLGSPAFLTTSEAAELTGYTPDHIGLLRRRGRIDGKMRGRDWFISRESLEKYVKSQPKVGRPRR